MHLPEFLAPKLTGCQYPGTSPLYHLAPLAASRKRGPKQPRSHSQDKPTSWHKPETLHCLPGACSVAWPGVNSFGASYTSVAAGMPQGEQGRVQKAKGLRGTTLPGHDPQPHWKHVPLPQPAWPAETEESHSGNGPFTKDGDRILLLPV